MTSQPAPDPTEPERRVVAVRRAPRVVPFLVLGAVLGILAAAIIALSGPGSEQFDRSAVFGFFAVLLAIAGAALGAIVVLLLDRRSIRRSERAVVEASEPVDGESPA